MADTAPISKQEQADPTPGGLAALWGKELSAAKENQKEWWARGDKIISRYLVERTNSSGTKIPFFTANTQNMEALLFGRTPEVDVTRRFADSEDDQARVASEMLERILNTDIEKDDDTQQEALKNALADRLRPGLGVVWVRYEMGETETQPAVPAQTDPQTGAVLAPEVPEQEMRPNERVCVDYTYWKDILWSPCRTHAELRWVARSAELSEEQFNERFPGKEEAWTANRKNPASANDATKVKDPLDRCVVWEIWSKERKKVYWYIVGADILDQKDDPLGLDGFWPFPRPMFANLTTSKLLPTPDFVIAQDLYDSLDNLATRIDLLEQAIRVVGAYDKNSDEVKRMVSQTAQNEMIGVDQWAMFAEKGGIKGVVDWFPIDVVVAALDKLREVFTFKMGLVFQITGMSDIMRGQAAEQATATEQAIKARFASVRVQTLQDEFARFASDTQKIKAEIISKHFDPNTIITRSNVMRTPDAQLAQQAVQLIKAPDFEFRISVNPDSVSLQDFAALKQERFEWTQAIQAHFQGMIPLIQLLSPVGGGPAAVQFALDSAKTLSAGMKGGAELEGIFDQFAAALKQLPPPQQQSDPKVEAAKTKADAEQFKAKADVASTVLGLNVAQQKHGMEMQKMGMQMQQQQAQHVNGIQSEEAKARAQAMEGVNKVTQGGPT